jgi:hypothetical protein
MVWMRRSDIISRRKPELAVELAADAARHIDGREVGRLAASIARQQALMGIDQLGFDAILDYQMEEAGH